MSNAIRYFLALLIFWIGLFAIQHSCFLFWSHHQYQGVGSTALWATYRHGFPMDLATACYLLLPMALAAIPLMFKELPVVRAGMKFYLWCMVVLAAFINVCDIALFASWGTKINHKALSYLRYPQEAMDAAAGAPMEQLAIVLIAQCTVAFLVLSRVDHARSFRTDRSWQRITFPATLPLLLLIGMRGGVQDYPIDRSWSYHSDRPLLNLAALNGVWNVIVLLAEPPEIEHNPYNYLAANEATKRFGSLHPIPTQPIQRITTTHRPNIVVVLLESWTADVVGVLGGDSAVTPGYDRLARNGLLFSQFHSTGFRTEQGLCALISGFPSQPRTTIIRQYGKFDRLPSLVNVLDSAGYHSTYYYAGDVTFANTRAYLDAMGFDKVHDESSFPIERRTRWGAYDEELFNFHIRDSRTTQEPFLHVIMTSTSHEPFDVPVDEGFPGDTDPQRYRNSVHYTDRTLAAFMDSCKMQDWYDRTLFVIVADHGHYLPHYRGNHTQERHRIPLLITGGALEPDLRGTTNTTYGSHVDLATTLLHQLQLNDERFIWSKDLLAGDIPHFAFWTFDDGFGIADARQTQVMDNVSGIILQRRDTLSDADRDALQLTDAKALEQILMDQFIRLSQ